MWWYFLYQFFIQNRFLVLNSGVKHWESARPQFWQNISRKTCIPRKLVFSQTGNTLIYSVSSIHPFCARPGFPDTPRVVHRRQGLKREGRRERWRGEGTMMVPPRSGGRRCHVRSTPIPKAIINKTHTFIGGALQVQWEKRKEEEEAKKRRIKAIPVDAVKTN